MIKFRQTPKRNYSYTGTCEGCNCNGAEEQRKKPVSRFVVIYRYHGDTVNPEEIDFDANKDGQNDSLASNRIIDSSLPDDWQLIGLIPKKEAVSYSNDEYFCLDEQAAGRLQQDITRHAQDKLLSYIAYRERALSECIDYLRRLPVSKEISRSIIDKVLKKNYINDKRFAELLVESAVSRKKSRIETKAALIKKRIASEIIEDVLSRFYTTENIAGAIDYHLERAIKKYPAKDSVKDYHKCIAYFIKKGFKYDDFIEKIKSYYRYET